MFPKSKKKIKTGDDNDDENDDLIDKAAEELLKLAGDVDMEGELMADDDEEDDNEDGWIDEREEMTEDELRELSASVSPVRLLLTKLRKVSFAIKNSTTLLLPYWFSVLRDLNKPEKMMPRDVATRWNSTFDMLDFAVEHITAINTVTADREMKLRKYELSEADWGIARELRDILKIFKDATLFFSRGTPSIATVIPAMDHIDEHLATAATNRKYPLAIQASIAIGKKTLNRYYNQTDHSDIYRIAMVLHPRHKLKYFENAGWKKDWVEKAKEIVRAEFDKSYGSLDATWAMQPQASKSNITSSISESRSQNIFDNLPALKAPKASELRGELERYLATDPVDVSDALAWWHEQKNVFPRLHRMALDYLSIPATSVDVERTFSQGRLLLSHIRNRLCVQSTRALLCLGVWSLMDYVKIEDIRAATVLPEVGQGEVEDLAEDWDAI